MVIDKMTLSMKWMLTKWLSTKWPYRQNGIINEIAIDIKAIDKMAIDKMTLAMKWMSTNGYQRNDLIIKWHHQWNSYWQNGYRHNDLIDEIHVDEMAINVMTLSMKWHRWNSYQQNGYRHNDLIDEIHVDKWLSSKWPYQQNGINELAIYETAINKITLSMKWMSTK